MVISGGPTMEDYIRRGDIVKERWIDPHSYLLGMSSGTDLTAEVALGPQLFVMRMNPPSVADNTSANVVATAIPHPDIDQGRLVLTHRDTRRLCHFYYDTINWKPGTRKGVIFGTRLVALPEKRD